MDDPYLYGQIAAANSLSDIYAMGADPKLAMNIICIPSCLPQETVAAILKGGYDKVAQAGAIITGGHTIEDEEPKYGLSVTGFAHPKDILTNSGAKVGDVLLLTKPLGFGILMTAIKAGLTDDATYNEATSLMATLNKYAKEAMDAASVNACTDVTGFGFLGHIYEVASGSGVSIEVFTQELPILTQAITFAKMGIIPAGAYQNRSYLEDKIEFNQSVGQHLYDIMFDPQTSGGLLISLPLEEANSILPQLNKVCPYTKIVGNVVQQRQKSIFIK